MSAFSPRQMFLLDLACKPISEAFNGGVYHVGTSAEGRQEYRDVDVRVMLADKDYDRLVKAIGQDAVNFLSLAVAVYLASQTAMPIDFQFQRTTEANAKHGDKFRNPLGIRPLFVFGGDAPKDSEEA